jgi:hypothetical protein
MPQCVGGGRAPWNSPANVARLRHELQSKQIAVSLYLAQALPHVLADRTQLHHVIVNLAINAVQVMAQGGELPDLPLVLRHMSQHKLEVLDIENLRLSERMTPPFARQPGLTSCRNSIARRSHNWSRRGNFRSRSTGWRLEPRTWKPDGDHVQQCADDWKSREIPGTTTKLQDTEIILVSGKSQQYQKAEI